jgi:hypothetical protein
MVALLECQERFLAEMRTLLGDLDEMVPDESRARIKAQLRTLGEVLDWSEAVQGDLLQESRWAAAGFEPTDLVALCAEAAARHRESHPQCSVTVLGTARRPVWASVPALTALLELTLSLVSERVREGSGLIFEVGEAPDSASVRCVGAGDPVHFDDPELVGSFLRAVSWAGVRIEPDELGPGGAGLVIRLPSTPR